MKKENVLQNLQQLIGQSFDLSELNNEVICSFGDFQEYGKNEVIFNKSQNEGYDYIAYINHALSSMFLINIVETMKGVTITNVSIA